MPSKIVSAKPPLLAAAQILPAGQMVAGHEPYGAAAEKPYAV